MCKDPREMRKPPKKLLVLRRTTPPPKLQLALKVLSPKEAEKTEEKASLVVRKKICPTCNGHCYLKSVEGGSDLRVNCSVCDGTGEVPLGSSNL